MINEYLFVSDEYRSDVEKLKFDGVKIEINDIEKADIRIARFIVEGRGEDSARKLSDVHDKVTEFGPKVLTCESSQYFNKTLFPLVNDFECKLRKLIYLADAVSDKNSNNIGELEKKDFGKIFDLLFIDEGFIEKLKARVTASKGSKYEGKSRYTKSEILKFLNDTAEDTLWDKIFDEYDVPTLKKRFRDIQTYRNDVMHAHNIGKKAFGEIRYLFKKVNDEIDKAIGKRIDVRKEDTSTNVSEAIYTALQRLTDVGEAIRSEFADLHSVFDPIAERLSSGYAERLRETVEMLDNPELKALRREYDWQNRINEELRTPEYIEALKQSSEIEEYLRQQRLEIPKGPQEALKTEQPGALEDLKEKIKEM